MSGQQIVLIGLSGVGKSTIGRVLAERLGWPFLDTDDLITSSEGRTPAQLIDDIGEDEFRKIEERVLTDVGKHLPAVISTGGGAFLSAKNRSALGMEGFICYLDATPNAIASRLLLAPSADRRPLLGDDPSELASQLDRLNRERRKYYSHADVWIPVQPFGDADTVLVEAVDRILKVWATDSARLIGLPRRLERLGSGTPAVGPAGGSSGGGEGEESKGEGRARGEFP